MMPLVVLYDDRGNRLSSVENGEIGPLHEDRELAEDETGYRVRFDVSFPVQEGGCYRLGTVAKPTTSVRLRSVGPTNVPGRFHVEAVEIR